MSDLAKTLKLKPIGNVELRVEGFLKGSETKRFNLVNLTIKLGRQFYRVKALETGHMPQNLTVPD